MLRKTRDEEQRGQRRAGFHKKHHRVFHHPARAQLHDRIEKRAPHDGRIEQREFFLRCHGQNTFPAFMRKCSTYGPSERTGKYVSAPTMSTTPTSRKVK